MASLPSRGLWAPGGPSCLLQAGGTRQSLPTPSACTGPWVPHFLTPSERPRLPLQVPLFLSRPQRRRQNIGVERESLMSQQLWRPLAGRPG